MLFFANLVVGLIALGNLAGFLLGKAPSLREVVGQMIGMENGLSRLKSALVLGLIAQAYLLWLTLPLKDLNYHVGLAWAVLMVISATEAVYTARKLYAAVSSKAPEPTFPVHESAWYRAYQIFYNTAVFGACVFLNVHGTY